jgi:hypothetical protein
MDDGGVSYGGVIIHDRQMFLDKRKNAQEKYFHKE